MPGIKVENLNKAFNSFKAVDNVSFEIQKGDLVSLLGPSGSGKSTILRIIAGLEEQDSGRIILSGEDVSEFKTQKRNIGFVFQHYALFRHMTVEQNIAFGLEIRKISRELIRDKISEMIDLVKLNGYGKHYPNQLSGGQRQRVALARALAPDPSILLLDEPFGALDSKVRKNLAAWIKEMHSRVNLTSIFVTHDQSEAMEISSKIIVINKGRKEQSGSPREIYESPASPFVASFVGRVNVIEGILSEKGLIPENTDKIIPLPFISEKLINKRVILFIRPEEISAHEKSTETFSAEHTDSVYKGDSYSITFKTGDFVLSADIPKKEFKLLSEKNINLRINEYRVFENSKDKGMVRDMILQKGYIE